MCAALNASHSADTNGKVGALYLLFGWGFAYIPVGELLGVWLLMAALLLSSRERFARPLARREPPYLE